MKTFVEPFWWSLFGAGGAISAMVLPVLLIIFCILVPLGLIEAPSYDALHKLMEPLLVRLGLLAVITLSMIHWAHRFRFTLYEGLQLHHYKNLIAVLCYGSAITISALTAYYLFTF